MSNIIPLCCGVALIVVSACSPNQEETAYLSSLEGTWRNQGTAYQYYDTDHKLLSRDTAHAQALGGMTITRTAIHLFRDGGEPMEEPWTYERHGDSICFADNSGVWTILELTPHQLVTRVELPYPFADKSDTARYAFISYHIRSSATMPFIDVGK